MSQGGCNATLFEHELSAFGLAAGLDRPQPCCFDFDDRESRRLDDSLDALDVVRLCAPVLALDAADAVLLPDPVDDCTRTHVSSKYGPTPCNNKTRRRSGSDGGATSSPKPHRHHCKKASRKQVHELQVMVNAMQVQVNGAAAEIQQLAQLVGQFARQREQEQERFRRLEQQQEFAEQEMDMDLDVQQRHLCAQVEHDREQYEQQQQYCEL
ncbi:hypothetical protein P3T76_010863 [Phytophthora citrophthora]|uniref:Uncharacterized protein n=1 Tax=Phytophthora citrophthora TaxID=4793 RepID=A0AAD9GB50_9STRA|nr:hypothetical protein P3T76_010863 [Phytophthora citrophthora]